MNTLYEKEELKALALKAARGGLPETTSARASKMERR